MKMIEDKTRIGTRNCITFKNRKAEKTFLEIKNGAGCDSKVGKSNHKAPQILNLNRFPKLILIVLIRCEVMIC